MSKPAAVNLKIAKVKGKAIPPGSSFAEVDWDQAQEYLSGQHNPDDYLLGSASQIAHDEILELEAAGRDAKARRVRADLNAFQNARHAIRASWCPTCLNFLHNCQCEVERPPVSTDFIDSITSQIPIPQTHSYLRKMKRLAKGS
jgi:hypothetical protein